MEIRPRETVILAADYASLVAWYRDVLGFKVVQQFSDGYNYAYMETASGIKIGIGSAEEMGVVPVDRSKNTVILQVEVDDVQHFFTHLEEAGGAVTFGPSLDDKDKFWFDGFAETEENPCWVVDKSCP